MDDLCPLGRGVAWSLRNKRPEKLKDSLKEVEVGTGNWVSGRYLGMIPCEISIRLESRLLHWIVLVFHLVLQDIGGHIVNFKSIS